MEWYQALLLRDLYTFRFHVQLDQGGLIHQFIIQESLCTEIS